MFLRRLWRAFTRAVRLACPRCGARTLFRGVFAMHERCAVCGLVFEREPGYWIGAIYINYAITACLMLSGYFLLDAGTALSLRTQLIVWCGFGIVFPLVFFRHSKSFWLAVDHLLSPEDSDLHVINGHQA